VISASYMINWWRRALAGTGNVFIQNIQKVAF
jgi:hypothetical protein